nr:hypothetical protein [Massilia polaris]
MHTATISVLEQLGLLEHASAPPSNRVASP